KQKNPKYDLRNSYKKFLELSIVFTLFFLILTVQIAKNFSFTPPETGKVKIKIEVADIPKTEQHRLPPPPARPQVPIPTESEEIPEDLTISSTELNLTEIPPPPPPLEDELPIFFAYDEPPEIIGGVAALHKHLKYPELARVSGIEGIVYVNVLVGVSGKAEKLVILKAKPQNIGFEEEALRALRKVKWKPAKQRDRAIRCWISVPVRFEFIKS
ncbi:MAG: energy transducer TonB, partial [Calditrichaeota bacterium]